MRVSVVKEDPGYARNLFHVKAFLDGKEAKHCVTADTEQGFVDIVVFDSEGLIVIDKSDEVVTQRMMGVVTLEMPPDWHPVR